MMRATSDAELMDMIEGLQDEIKELKKDVKTVKNRSYCGDGVAFMVFVMWLCFVLNGCDFK